MVTAMFRKFKGQGLLSRYSRRVGRPIRVPILLISGIEVSAFYVYALEKLAFRIIANYENINLL